MCAHRFKKPALGAGSSKRSTASLLGLSLMVALAVASCLTEANNSAGSTKSSNLRQAQVSKSNSTTAAATTSTTNNSQAPTASNKAASSENAGSMNSTGAANLEQQASSADMSSIYVQIPIAEPNEAEPSAGQQSIDETSAGGSSNPAWSGNWPKKFQIGYIKQSDLHQVLIESLKNEPFISIGGAQPGAGSPAPAGKTPVAPSSGTSGGATKSKPQGAPPAPAPATKASQHQPAPQWPILASEGTGGANYAGHSQLLGRHPRQHQPLGNHANALNSLRQFHQQQQQHHAARLQQQQLPVVGPPLHRFQSHGPINKLKAPQPQRLAQFRQQPQQQQQQLQQLQQHYPANHKTIGQQVFGQQFQYSSPPSSYQMLSQSFPPSMSYYTTGANNQQQTIQQISDSEQPQIELAIPQLQQQQQQQPMALQPTTASNFANSRGKTSSGDYYHGSSWKPVPAENPIGQNKLTEPEQKLNEEFDDGGNFASKDGSLGSMNMHPVLNSYLADSKANGKLSPAMISRKQVQGGEMTTNTANESTKQQVAGKTSATKGSGSGTKGSPDSSGIQSSTRSRASDGANSTTTTTTIASGNDANGTTISPIEASASSTTAASVNTTTTQSSQAEGETTDPESEVLDSVTTEPTASSGGAAESTTTTTAQSSSLTTGAETSSPSPLPSLSSSSGSSGQNEAGEPVELSTQSGSGSSSSSSSTTTSFPAEAGTAGEESSTTPVSTGVTQAGLTKTTEIEGAVSSEMTSDDALRLSAAKSELSKNGKQTASSKPARSNNSDRLTKTSAQKAPEAGKAGAGAASRGPAGVKAASGANKKASAVAASGQRAGKQVSLSGGKPVGVKLVGLGGKSAQKNNNKQQQQKLASKKTTSSSNSKLAGQKNARIASNERLLNGQQPVAQVVSMSAAQAQSTAQTLASILLSRCLSSTNCAHLLDVCSTKQAQIGLPATTSGPIASSVATSSNTIAELAASSGEPNALDIGGVRSNWSTPIGLHSSSLMVLAQSLQADKALRLFPQWKETVEGVMDQEAQTGYTLLLPSNEAVDRLPAHTLDTWLTNADLLAQLVDNHILDSAETVDFLSATSGRQQQQQHQQQQQVGDAFRATRMIRSKGLQVNQHRDRMVTVNGKRMIYANQLAPAGGRIHVIDGFVDSHLHSTVGSATSAVSATSGGSAAPLTTTSRQQLDVMETLKQCDKFDGFVTLAEGTGLTQVLKQDGPITVFVPSNEALRRIPDDELEVIKNNSTALQEFLMYHVVNGSYFSQDLRDGQQLASVLNMKPIQVGVRVDGCSRRLVEANTSPMRRPDIVAKNGVIHILDWYLTVRDNDWCEQTATRPASLANGSAGQQQQQQQSSALPPPSAPTRSQQQFERLEQLGSETGAASSYATRLSLPANHKPATASGVQQQQQQQQQHHGLASDGLDL